MVYLITYDLNTPGQKYEKLYEEIKTLGAWWHYLESVWIVDTSLNANQITEKLKRHMAIDANDRLLVIAVKQDYEGWLSKSEEAFGWLKEHL
ncbi:MAG: hypothetical protein E6713_05985 [Sporomusaceae bacterium]|nr:hypothetical protein [Sporomusaceae bacterium]